MRLPFLFLLLAAAAGAARAGTPAPAPVDIPGGAQGVGFDDLGYARDLDKVLVPGGRTGQLFLVDPVTRDVAPIPGFTASRRYRGGHGEGATSADAGGGLLFGVDRDARTVVAVDARKRRTVATARLGAAPDLVRWEEGSRQVWVTEPSARRIETFSVSTSAPPALRKAGEIPVPGGLESLALDPLRARAYANLRKGATLAIDLANRRVVARWSNGCRASRGLAVDPDRGFIFVGCAEGKAVVLEPGTGRIASSAPAGEGVDQVAFSPGGRRLYVPASKSEMLWVYDVSTAGVLRPAAQLPTARGDHCVAADERGGVWVCDPDRGRLLFFQDQAPPRDDAP